MASIHRDRHDPPRSKNWFIAYRLPDGRRTFRSAKTTDKATALKLARQLETAAREAGRKELTESRALSLLSEFVEATTGEAVRNYTVSQWLHEWLQGKKSETSAPTLAKYSGVVAKFLLHLGPRSSINLRAVLPSDVRDYRESERLSGKTAASCNDNLAVLRGAFSEARRQGLNVHSPADAVKRLKHDSEPLREAFTLKQVQAL